MVSYSHPFSIALHKKVDFYKPNQSLYFWKPRGSSPAKVTFNVYSSNNPITATFKNESEKVLGVYDIDLKRAITVPLTKSFKGEAIKLEIQPKPGARAGSVRIEVHSGLEKYISPFKNGLVHSMKR